ncbi:hypothetical protein [Methanobrevibacter sp.]|uniref:hypothetical protein n=1 Tax=Methanobrevibacter sp. TaxID=66852 RepID=UPI0026059B6C|nr:hypothetical protein [uncultured Methanobrevibacter sp.]
MKKDSNYNEKVQIEILFFLYNEGCFGKYHYPIKGIQHKIIVNGTRVPLSDLKKAMKILLKKQLILRYKKLKNIHLNPHKKEEILLKIQTKISDRLNFK